MNPTVSVIIPTHNRPGQLIHAVQSVLDQRLNPDISIEIIVVQDGPDSRTAKSLDSIRADCLHVIVNPYTRGHATSRNIGVANAKGAWCAFLDDDDTWMPEKLSVQLDTALAASAHGKFLPVVGCVLEARTQNSTHLWPEQFPEVNQPIGDYLYARKGIRSVLSGHTLLQTSMLLVPTEFMNQVPFSSGMRRHADPDWLLRAGCFDYVRFVFPEHRGPLAVWNIGGTKRVSSSGDWRYSLAWARRHRHLLSADAYSGFLSGPAAHIAAGISPSRDRRAAFAALLREMFAENTPSIWDLLAVTSKFINLANYRSRLTGTHDPESRL